MSVGLNDLAVIKQPAAYSKDETLRALRLAIEAELEAINLYSIIAGSVSPELKNKINSVIEEEKLHVGEFLSMVDALDKAEIELYNKGSEEAKTKAPALPLTLAPANMPEMPRPSLEDLDDEIGILLREEEE